MPRLYRPHIPIKVRCRVAMRQLGEMWPDRVLEEWEGPLGALLDMLLAKLGPLLSNEEVIDLHLDHDPPLAARGLMHKRKTGTVVYVPDANDPEHLVYREKHAHHIKTNVRGEGAQHPDRVLIKKQRRRERGKQRRRGPPIRSRKSTWPKGRKLTSANRWPKKDKQR